MPETMGAAVEQPEQTVFNYRLGKLVQPWTEEFHFGEVLADEFNNWQKLARATNDIVTPANAIDAAGFALSMYGIQRLDSWKGIGAAMSGFMADFVDGKVARATGTQSALGEAIDAGGDKVKLAYALYRIWQLELAPKPLILAIGIQNGLNVGLTAIDRKTNDTPLIHPSQFGKKAIFIEQWGLGLHVIGDEVAKTNEKRGRALKLAGNVMGVAGVAVGTVATAGYTRALLKGRRQK